MKKLLFLIISSFLFLVSSFSVSAADVTITCNPDGCSSSSTPFFDETDTFPGYSSTKTLEVINHHSTPCSLHQNVVNTNSGSILPQKLIFDISNNSNVYFNDNLTALFNTPNLDLGNIAAGQTKTYVWGTTFDQLAGNEYQNASTVFDLESNFTCEDIPSPTPTSITTQSPTNTPVTTNNPSTCNNSFPEAPTNLRTRRLADGRVTLMWTETVSPHTGYLVAYGDAPGNYLYGVPDVGNEDHFTVGGLTYGAQYCFYVRSLNGCMPGDKTNEVCVISWVNHSGKYHPYPPSLAGCLGVSTATSDIVPPSILGTTTSCSSDWIPFVFIIAFFLNVGYFLLIFGNPILPVFISILAFAIDRYLLNTHCCQVGNILCNYYYVGSIASFLVPWSVSRLASRHH